MIRVRQPRLSLHRRMNGGPASAIAEAGLACEADEETAVRARPVTLVAPFAIRWSPMGSEVVAIIGAGPTTELRPRLEASLSEQGVEFRGAPFYSHLLPSPTAAFLRRALASGPGWAMIGDAAGFVDPITGEGLYYALRSADLLARALIAGRPECYPQWLRWDFLPELETAAGFVERFFRGSFAGAPVLERMVQFAARSPRFRALLLDLFAGSQGYSGLRRAYGMLPRILLEIASSAVRPRQPTTNNQRPVTAL